MRLWLWLRFWRRRRRGWGRRWSGGSGYSQVEINRFISGVEGQVILIHISADDLQPVDPGGQIPKVKGQVTIQVLFGHWLVILQQTDSAALPPFDPARNHPIGGRLSFAGALENNVKGVMPYGVEQSGHRAEAHRGGPYEVFYPVAFIISIAVLAL